MFSGISVARSAAGALAALILGAFWVGSAQAETYTLTAPVFSDLFPHSAADCSGVGGCVDYNTTTHKVTGFFITAAPLANNLANVAIVPLSWSFSDGIHTITSVDAGRRVYNFSITTNGAGVITQWDIEIEKWRDNLLAGHTSIAANATTSNGRFDMISTFHNQTIAYNDLQCGVYGPVPSGAADTCSAPSMDTFTSAAAIFVGGSWVVSASVVVPTLSEWVMIVLAGLLGAAGVMAVRRRGVPQ